MQQLFYFEQLKQGQGVEKVVMMLESSLMPAALPSVEARSRAGMLRMVAAAALLCGLTCAALVVSWSGISPTRLLGDEENMPWKPFPVPGLNTGYTKLAAAFEAGHFDAAPRLPKIGFDKMPSIGWNGTLPVEPVRENEVNHGFVEKPFERLPAPLQANISAAHALEAAEVAQKAFSGGGGGAEEGEVLNDGGVKGEAQEQRPAESPAAAKAVKGEGMLTSLQKTAEALTTKAEEAVNAFKQAERRISNDKQRAQRANIQSDWQRDEEATFAHQAQSTGPLPGEDARKDIPKAFAKSGAPETHASEEAALLSAKRMVDSALRRLASKKERLQQGREGEVDDGERGEGEGEREGDQVKEQLSHAQQALYDKYQREYYAALRHTEEREFPHFEERETPKTWGVGFHDEARRQALDLSGGGVRQIKVEHDAGDVMAANWKHVSAIPTSGPFERATIVKDVPVRIWPMVGQYGHTHSWPYVAMNGDLVAQNEDPPVAPSKCADDPISVDCTGGFGGGVKSTGGPMDTRVQWRHDNELGWRPEIDGPVRVDPALQQAWNMYYGYAGDRSRGGESGAGERAGSASAAGVLDASSSDPQQLWDGRADKAAPPAWSAEKGVVSAWSAADSRFSLARPRFQAFSPFAGQ